ncbi:hypothetical protein Aperf_G00000104839 [Anoplocephala perfoliata]
MPISPELWKKILLFGSPALIAALAGICYYYRVSSQKTKEAIVKGESGEESPQLAAIALKNRGNRYFKVGRYDKAVECYTEALEQCPLESVEDRATFYQNRAAARENLGEIENAIVDCNSSLELCPTYIKALNRRARLYEKLGNLEDSLHDITACCLLGHFQNNDNVEAMDRVLKEIAKKLEKEEPLTARRLPSSDFIKFYLSSWSCDVFSCEAMKIHGKKPVVVETQSKERKQAKEDGAHHMKAEEEKGDVEKGDREKASTVDEKGVSEKGSTVDEKGGDKEGSAVDEKGDKEKGSAADEKGVSEEGSTVDEKGDDKKGSAVDEKGDKEKGSATDEKGVSEEGSTVDEKGDDKKGSAVDAKGDNEKDSAVEEKGDDKKKSETSDSAENGSPGKDEEKVEKKKEEKEVKLPSRLIKAYEDLEKAFDKMKIFEYEEAYGLAKSSVKNFNAALKVDLYVFEKSPLGDREKPESARARALLLEATFNALLGETEEAKTRFLSIGESFFAHPSIRVNALIKAAALFMTVQQDMSGCMYTFQQAETLDPSCADVYLHRGQTHLLMGNLEAADKDFAEAIRLKPDFSVAQAQHLYLNYRKAASEGRMSDHKKVLNDFKLLIEKFPTCIESHSVYAQILTELGNFGESDKEFAKIIELSPNSGMAYAQRGILYLRLKQDTETAEKWIEKGLEADPHCELAWELRGQLAMEKGEHEKAVEYFQKALDETRISSDRIHLFALREGVKAQLKVAKTYNLNLTELFAQVKQDLQTRMMQAMSDGYGGLMQSS